MCCVKNEIWLTACHVPGVLNFEADKSSRQFNKRIEWQLQPSIFLKIIDIFGTLLDFRTVGSSRLPDTGLVAPATKPSGGKSITAPTRRGPPHPSTIRDSTSSTKPNETDGMSVVRQYYETRGVSKSAVGFLMAWHSGEEVLRNNAYINTGTSKNGKHFVSKGKSIIFNHR